MILSQFEKKTFSIVQKTKIFSECSKSRLFTKLKAHNTMLVRLTLLDRSIENVKQRSVDTGVNTWPCPCYDFSKIFVDVHVHRPLISKGCPSPGIPD